MADTKTPAEGGQVKSDPHPGMMGDGTEEQNLNQPGDPDARITAEEVEEAFGQGDAPKEKQAER